MSEQDAIVTKGRAEKLASRRLEAAGLGKSEPAHAAGAVERSPAGRVLPPFAPPSLKYSRSPERFERRSSCTPLLESTLRPEFRLRFVAPRGLLRAKSHGIAMPVGATSSWAEAASESKNSGWSAR
jgi:hypothetical protein